MRNPIELRFSEALRLGAATDPKAINPVVAAVRAVGTHDDRDEIDVFGLICEVRAHCPECGHRSWLSDLLIHLRQQHSWSCEHLALFVELVELRFADIFTAQTDAAILEEFAPVRGREHAFVMEIADRLTADLAGALALDNLDITPRLGAALRLALSTKTLEHYIAIRPHRSESAIRELWFATLRQVQEGRHPKFTGPMLELLCDVIGAPNASGVAIGLAAWVAEADVIDAPHDAPIAARKTEVPDFLFA